MFIHVDYIGEHFLGQIDIGEEILIALAASSMSCVSSSELNGNMTSSFAVYSQCILLGDNDASKSWLSASAGQRARPRLCLGSGSAA